MLVAQGEELPYKVPNMDKARQQLLMSFIRSAQHL